MKDAHSQFIKIIKRNCPQLLVYKDPLHCLAWGTDAGFYRKIPRYVMFPQDEAGMAAILRAADRTGVALCFRAAGTSLSGQSITDSVLVVAGKKWEKCRLNEDATQVWAQPGLLGERLNEILRPFGRKFSPDPASIKSAMLGGIIANNASGMNCGTHANSDKILLSVRMLLADGTLLDTGDPESRAAFAQSHPDFLKNLEAVRDRVRADAALSERIRYKYSIKNVMGLNLLPLIVEDDIFDCMAHLMVGSEGCLAFMAEAHFRTEAELPFKASGLLCFKDIYQACRAVQKLKKLPVVSAELLDRKALSSVQDKDGIPPYIKDFDDKVTAVLVETKASSEAELKANTALILEGMQEFETAVPVRFTDNPDEYRAYWNIRSGIFPSVGGMRPAGTTCLIEDIAFHIEDLPQAVAELQALLVKYGYSDGVIYGHALEGNIHFILNQSFTSRKEVQRYESFMNEVADMVVDKYDGSLKAEHGTGRNMAPFVGREWGSKAFGIMKEIKALFDPKNILNRGVIFNEDPRCHLRDFKPLPLCNPIIDKCIECGFCESNCLTAGLVLSSRQRIVLRREISRLRNSPLRADRKRARILEKAYYYPGRATCAGDSLCSLGCPMNIDTGELTHFLRQEAYPRGSAAWRIGRFAGKHLSGIEAVLRSVLRVAHAAHVVLGTRLMSALGRGLHALGLPFWSPAMPMAHKIKLSGQPYAQTALLKSGKAAEDLADKPAETASPALKVVYFPSCINQTMGTARGDGKIRPLSSEMVSLLNKAGYEVLFPARMERLCCGTIWESKGMIDIADAKTAELELALWEASGQGRYPVLCDQSPCLYRMRKKIKKMELYEPVEFIEKFLVPRLEFSPVPDTIAIHTTCSTTKMEIGPALLRLAKRCADKVIVPKEVGCCGFAGDKGFTHPEVNAYALRKLRSQIEAAGVKRGYSNSRTCEIGLSTNTGIPYVSIVYLVNACTRPKKL